MTVKGSLESDSFNEPTSNPSSLNKPQKPLKQIKKSKSNDHSISFQNEESKNKAPKLEANISQDETVNSNPMKIKRNRYKPRTKNKKETSPSIENNKQLNLDENTDKIQAKPKSKKQIKCDKTDQSEMGVSLENVKSQPKKSKKKGNKKKKFITQITDKDQQSKCIDYLNKWKNDRGNWKFEKVQQLRLLTLIFEKEKIPKESYQIFLEYMEKASDSSKSTLKMKANDIILAMEKWESMSEEEKSTSTTPDTNKYKRARSVLQHFE